MILAGQSPRPERLPRLTETESDATAAIAAAIAAADYRTNGAPFEPFIIKAAEEEDFTPIWTSQRGIPGIAFYRYKGARNDGFLPLGDYARVEDAPRRMPILLLKPMPGHEDALAHPTSFDDYKSGNDRDLTYFGMVAPDGYMPVGIAVTNGELPRAEDYWCVNVNYLSEADLEPFWSDSGSHWSHDGSLSAPVTKQGEGGGKLLIAPTTMLSDERIRDVGGRKDAFALRVEKLFLDVPGSAPVRPAYSDGASEGSRTPMGIHKVAVVPCNAVHDIWVGLQPADCPFYYVAGHPLWTCLGAYRGQKAGTFSHTFTIGSSTSSSKEFAQTTSLTVSADVGIEAGKDGGRSAHMSTSYTEEMSIRTSTTATHATETSDEVRLDMPEAERVLLWQRVMRFTTYRTNRRGDPRISEVASVDYMTHESDITASPDAGSGFAAEPRPDLIEVIPLPTAG